MGDLQALSLPEPGRVIAESSPREADTPRLWPEGDQKRPPVAGSGERRPVWLGWCSAGGQRIVGGLVEAHCPPFRRGLFPGFRLAGGPRALDVVLVKCGLEEERSVELGNAGQPRCSPNVTCGCGDAREGEDRFRNRSPHAEL